jgi:hypothetical protein
MNMPRSVGFDCKTGGCNAFLVVENAPDDRQRAVVVLLRIEEPRKITCPDCKQEHEYSANEKKMIGMG